LLLVSHAIAGMGIFTGINPRAGTGVGQKAPPRALAGTGAGKFLPRGDGDGKPFPDGEFPVAIPNTHHREPAVARHRKRKK
jgi:hypothetical protein